MLGIVVVCLPLLVLVIPAAHGHHVWLLLVVAPLYGVAVGSAGREAAARLWSRSGAEVLLKVNAQR